MLSVLAWAEDAVAIALSKVFATAELEQRMVAVEADITWQVQEQRR
jgi:hypothetical protein